jgi:probable phosphomutase (TIGR03848 family)
MTLIYLVRHGMCDPVGRLIAGRAPGVHLNEEGRAEVMALARHLQSVPLSRIISSPLERTVETADAIASLRGLPVSVDEGLIEIDFGDWTGRTLESLAPDEAWKRFNAARSVTRIPGGEWMLDVQRRMVRCMDELERSARGESVALVSHGDVIKAAIAWYAGMPLDFFPRFEIAPASVSIVQLESWGPEIRLVNGAGWQIAT